MKDYFEVMFTQLNASFFFFLEFYIEMLVTNSGTETAISY